MKTASLRTLAFLLACSGLQGPAAASEAITYTYDTLGRLIQVVKSGTPSAMTATYTYDPADNRTNVTVSTVGPAPLPSFSISSASVTEGGTLVFNVTKSGSTTSSFNVNFATSNGTAIAGSDYNSASGTLTFAPAENIQAISVATIDDAAVESAETLNVTLSGATGGAAISTAQGVGTINDNDTASPPSFTIASASVTEGGMLAFVVTKTGSTTSSFSLNFTTSNGTAIAGSDYNSASGTLTFAPAENSKTINVATIDDTVVESAETLTVTLSGATAGAAISTAQGIGTINDNDTASPPSFAIASTSATEGGALVFTVSKTGSTTGSFSVSFATSDGTAQAGSDYVATSGTISFSPAEASKTFSVSSIDDTAIEGDESFTATLSSATGGATITTSAVTGTIVDNDSGPTICRDERGTIIPCEQPLTARKAGA